MPNLILPGKIHIRDEECELNKEFIDDALRLADHFNLDEILAGQYLYAGCESTAELDRDAYHAALFICMTTRKLLLDTFRVCLDEAISQGDRTGTGSILLTFLHRVIGPQDVFIPLCCTALEALEAQVRSLDESQNRDRLLGTWSSQDDHDSEIAALKEQHENICAIMAKQYRLNAGDAHSYLDVVRSLKNVSHWDSFVSHRLITILCVLQTLSICTDRVGEVDIHSATTRFCRAVLQEVRTIDTWSVRPICAILQIVLASELNGLCHNSSELGDAFDYEQEILSLARSAMENNAFQHMITFSLFTRNDVELKNPFSLFFTSDAFSHYKSITGADSTTLTTHLIDQCLRTFIDSMIVNLADLLKEIHVATEDLMLSQEVGETAVVEDGDHSENLFLGVIYTAHVYEADSGRAFWDDKQGNLYGFLTWGSYAEVPSTIYSYFKMMTALTNGSECAMAGLDFFNSTSTSENSIQELVPSITITWTFIFDSIRYYINQLDRGQSSDTFEESPELDVYNTLILEAYLSSIQGILTNVVEHSVILKVQSKFEVNASLFQFLACRLPENLYMAILDLLSVFAVVSDLQKGLWQLLEAWLGTISTEKYTSMLTTTVRRKAAEHRPLNSLIAFSSLAPRSTISLIHFLTVLSSPGDSQTGSLTFPESLGDNSRYPGTSDYVDFVWNCMTMAQTGSTELLLLDRIGITFASLKFFEASLSSLNLDLIYLSLNGFKDLSSAIAASSLQQYLVLHPGSRVMQQLSRASHHKALSSIIKSHNIADRSIKALLLPVATLALRLYTTALQDLDAFDEFVRPLLKSKIDSYNSMSNEIATDTELLVQTFLLCSEPDVQCSEAALSFLNTCEQHGLFDSRHLTILNSVDESKNILLGMVAIVASQESDLMDRKLQLMQLVTCDLEQSQSSPSVSFFILGLRPSPSGGELTLGNDPGQIGSGHSVFHVLLNLLETDFDTTQAFEPFKEHEFRRLATRTILMLCEHGTTASLVSPILGENAFYTSLLSRQQISLDHTSSQSPESLVSALTNSVEASISARSNFIRCLSKELLHHSTSQSVAVQQSYVGSLFPMQGNETRSGAVLMDYLDVLAVEPPPPPQLKIAFQIFSPERYGDYLQDLDKASCRRLQLALDLQLQQILRLPDANNSHRLARSEHENLVEHICHLISNKKVNTAVLRCMREWVSLATIVFDTLPTSQQLKNSVSSDLAQALLVKLPVLQETNPELADILCDGIAATLQFATALNTDHYIHFFQHILTNVHGPASTSQQREHLYRAGILCLRSIDVKGAKSVNTKLVAICKSGADRYLTILCRDIAVLDEVTSIVASSFLDLLLQKCDDRVHPFISDIVVRLNLLSRFSDQLVGSLKAGNKSEAIDRQLDVVLRFAMTRAGAQEFIQSSHLLTALSSRFFKLEGKGKYCLYNAVANRMTRWHRRRDVRHSDTENLRGVCRLARPKAPRDATVAVQDGDAVAGETL